MSRAIRTVKDVAEWGLCTGCGVCRAVCRNGAVSLVDIEEIGIRPVVDGKRCADCGECVSVCPGVGVDSSAVDRGEKDSVRSGGLLGPVLEVWEGWAEDEEIRRFGSSGGVLSALSLYLLEREGAAFVLHTGADPENPWKSRSFRSRTREELIERAGSRYAPAAPCAEADLIAGADGPCVFVGKPCDAAAIAMLRRKDPAVDRNLAAVLTFFCAGTPSTRATVDLLTRLGVEKEKLSDLKYRGDGWPGRLRIMEGEGRRRELLSYEDAWKELQKSRPMRCHLCADGVGELADVSCGDAWHRYRGEEPGGRSVVIARTSRGLELVRRAREAGYLHLEKTTAEAVVAGQGLTRRREELFGRLAAMAILFVPRPRYRGFGLFRSWLGIPMKRKAITVLGTLRRFLVRGLWHRNPLPAFPGKERETEKAGSPS